MLPDVIANLKPSFAKALGTDHFTMGDDCRVLVITGDNGAGKSFLRKFISATLANEDEPVTSLSLSMESRSRSNSDGDLLMTLAYGDESYRATSVNTINAIRSVLSTSRRSEKRNVIVLDEPEIGLSEETELAIGMMIAEECRDWPENRLGIFAMTHSRHVVRQLVTIEHAEFLNLGGEYFDAEAWLNRTVEPTDIDDFMEKNLEKFRWISKRLSGPKRGK